VTDLSGTTALITGAAGGIGRTLVSVFARCGAKVIALDRDERVAGMTFDGVERKSVVPCIADISNTDTLAGAIAEAREGTGPVRILINNAGFSGASNLESTTGDIWEHDIAINLNGAYHCIRTVLDDLKADGGAIVNIGSVNGAMSLGDPAYSAAKAGLVSLTRAVAMEYGRFNIRSNMVAPGTVRTPIWDHRVRKNPEIFDNLLKWYPLRRVAEPLDIANAAAFLASPQAAAITGAVLPVDCGLMAGNIVMSREITMLEF
jgi:NAD(P)-dependent dehydrogenase (short-subunit alcohol dehydrogenase family)